MTAALTLTEQKALLADCVAFAVGNLAMPIGLVVTDRLLYERLAAVEWKERFKDVLRKCGYLNGCEQVQQPVNNFELSSREGGNGCPARQSAVVSTAAVTLKGAR